MDVEALIRWSPANIYNSAIGHFNIPIKRIEILVVISKPSLKMLWLKYLLLVLFSRAQDWGLFLPIAQLLTEELYVILVWFFRQVLLRRAKAADELPGGYRIEAGQDVMISVYNIHHSPQVWDRPEEFLPERFDLDAPVPNESNTDYKYVNWKPTSENVLIAPLVIFLRELFLQGNLTYLLDWLQEANLS